MCGADDTGCAVGGGALARCTAAQRGRSCRFCIRERVEPSLEIDCGPGWLVFGRSVQAIYDPAARVWLVAVFRHGRNIDGRWPIIAVPDKLRAIDAALERARQVEPRGRTIPWPRQKCEQWRRGDLHILVAQPYGVGG